MIYNNKRLFNIILFISIMFNVLIVIGIGVHNYQKKIKTSNEIPINYYALCKIDQFKKYNHTSSDIILLGDSLTDQGEWAELFNSLAIKNRGISGDKTNDVLNRIDSVIETKPQKLFILIGINDITQKIQHSTTIENYEMIIKKIKIGSPNTKIYIQSILPVNNDIRTHKINSSLILQTNHELKRISIYYDIIYIDLYSAFSISDKLNMQYTIDGLHLNGEGYILWRNILKQYI